MKNMPSLKWLIVFVLLWSAVASAQSVFSLTEEQSIELILSEIQQVMQQAKADRIDMPLDLFFTVDGQPSSAVELVTSVNAVLKSMPARDIYASNPLPATLGTFWDFQINEPTLEFMGDTCHVNCSYLLTAAGIRTGVGHIDFVKIGRGYRVVRLDGLIPFLNQELQALKTSQRARGGEK